MFTCTALRNPYAFAKPIFSKPICTCGNSRGGKHLQNPSLSADILQAQTGMRLRIDFSHFSIPNRPQRSNQMMAHFVRSSNLFSPHTFMFQRLVPFPSLINQNGFAAKRCFSLPTLCIPPLSFDILYNPLSPCLALLLKLYSVR